MIRAKCPFCGRENYVGFFPEEPPMRCQHFVYQGFAKNLGTEYVRKEFSLEAPAGSFSLESDLMRILNGHFNFVGPVAFAPSDEARSTARRAVEDFLQARRLVG